MAWGDYDGDGDLDFAVTAYNHSTTKLYRNDGDIGGNWTFELAWESDGGTSVAWGDYDGDGDLDLAVGNICGTYPYNPDFKSVRLYRNDSGELVTGAVWESDEANSTKSLAWGDYDGDGDLDLAVGNYSELNQLYRNDGSGLATSAVIVTSLVAASSTSIAWGDYNNDGNLDLASGTWLSHNNGGSLTSSAVWSSLESNNTASVAWGDVDGNGYLDLVVGNNYNQPNRLYRNMGGA